jgi:hypothetical protein
MTSRRPPQCLSRAHLYRPDLGDDDPLDPRTWPCGPAVRPFRRVFHKKSCGMATTTPGRSRTQTARFARTTAWCMRKTPHDYPRARKEGALDEHVGTSADINAA